MRGRTKRESLRISYELTKEDLWHFNLLSVRRRAFSGRYFLERSLVVVGLVCCVSMFSLPRRRVVRFASRQDYLFGEHTVEVTPEGIDYRAPSGSGSTPWRRSGTSRPTTGA